MPTNSYTIESTVEIVVLFMIMSMWHIRTDPITLPIHIYEFTTYNAKLNIKLIKTLPWTVLLSMIIAAKSRGRIQREKKRPIIRWRSTQKTSRSFCREAMQKCNKNGRSSWKSKRLSSLISSFSSFSVQFSCCLPSSLFAMAKSHAVSYVHCANIKAIGFFVCVSLS